MKAPNTKYKHYDDTQCKNYDNLLIINSEETKLRAKVY